MNSKDKMRLKTVDSFGHYVKSELQRDFSIPHDICNYNRFERIVDVLGYTNQELVRGILGDKALNVLLGTKFEDYSDPSLFDPNFANDPNKYRLGDQVKVPGKNLYRIAEKIGELAPKIIVREQQISKICSDSPKNVMERVGNDIKNGGGVIYDKVDLPRANEPSFDTHSNRTSIA